MKKLTIIFFLSSGLALAKIDQCKSAREYITTLKYLRSHAEFAIKESDARKVADEISLHCSGSSARFIRITNLLSQAGMDTASAINTGKAFAKSAEETVSAYIEIFREAFLKKYLDLSLADSAQIAAALSIDFDGSSRKAQKDFHAMVKYCIDSEELEMPKLQCAQMATQVTEFGKGFEEKMTPKFIKLYRFLAFERKRPLFEALTIARVVLKSGPQAAENFITGYKYAFSKRGLGFTDRKSIEFGKKMAKRSLKP